MPDVDDQDEAVLLGVVPGLVLEVIVEHETAPLLPAPGLGADPDRAVAVRDDDPQVAAQPEVRGPAVGGDVGAGTHP